MKNWFFQAGLRRLVNAASLFVAVSALCWSLCPLSKAQNSPAHSVPVAADVQRHWQGYLQSPMLFEPNAGRWAGEVGFFARGDRYGAALTPGGILLTLATGDAGASMQATRLELRFVGGNPRAELAGEDALSARLNSYAGNEAAAWRSGLQAYAAVRYRSLYPGVDARISGRQRRLQFDFLVAPQADPSLIGLVFANASHIRLAPDGDLVIEAAGRTVRQLKPFTYQKIQGRQVPVASRYRIQDDGLIGFEIADYDHDLPLVIDPVISYASFLGGAAADSARSLALDSDGNLYATGHTLSSDFLVHNPLQPANGGGGDAFVTKLRSSDFEVLFSTYLGGSLEERGLVVAVEGSDRVYVVGQTFSFNFPTVNSIQSFRRGVNDVFISQFDPQGGQLLFSTYFGGGGAEVPTVLRLDGPADLCLIGYTTSIDLPLAEAIQGLNRGQEDIFISEFNNKRQLTFSTYLGGSRKDRAHDLFIDGDGTFILTGQTESADFPLVEPFQDERQGDRDAFVTRVDIAERTIVFSTYLGGSGLDSGRGIAVDSFSHLIVTGDTTSDDLPIINSIQAQPAGGSDLFIMRLSPVGNVPIFATYLGGTGDDFLVRSILDDQNHIRLAANTRSTDFPVHDPVQGANGGGLDGVLAEVDPAAQSLVFSTYLGGGGDDQIFALIADSRRWIVAGETSSPDFPVTADALQGTIGGASDGFLAALSPTFTLNFAQFGDGSSGEVSFRSQIELINLNREQAANLRLTLRDDQGGPLSVDLNGTTAEGEFKGVVPASGNLRLETDGQGMLQTGSVQAVSDVQVAGFIFFDAGSIGATGVGSSPALRGFVAPVRAGGGTNTGLALMGLSVSQDLELVLYDESGAERARADLTLPAFHHRALFVTEVDWTPAVDFGSFNGNLSVAGSADFSATAILTEPGKFIILPVAEREP